MRRKIKTLFLSVLFLILFTYPSQADLTGGYERLSGEYKDKAEEYITVVPDYTFDGKEVKCIFCLKEEAQLYTQTNVRNVPGSDREVVTTLDIDARVCVWGYTDNGWCKVWCVSADGNNYFGYIKADLLNPGTPPEPQTEGQSETAAQEN